ncbi:PEP/pyruvate-binding domain-containing protein [Actinocrispum wychmicini]|uniref:Pyruvate phosphate dikinase-like enzyme n=1 Tax=Actinocrispum wychmicini TaxID=1213861 RepID=A0A4R2K6F4_9PSEU|nr:PEP/pyruvate-binding domain-containing protein [Actinocrispum wychmicini]TCO61915.1 pyruvate phosphate dikinase-like enzyme [Actinocrispum wychmicini]
MPLATADSRDVGGKAANLARLLRLGFPVPPGWVVTLRADQLRRSGELSEKAVEALVREGMRTNCRTFAVRSSAVAEDSALASFAGQFGTDLNVPYDEVPAAVWRVAASADRSSAHAYARRLGVPIPRAMAVLVQEQLEPFLSGVCFTCHPVTGASELVLEYTHGTGDTLVSGGMPAGSYVLPRRPDGFDDERLTDVDERTGAWLRAAARLAMSVETQLGGPQDVEWAVDDRGLWVVQARPVTTVGKSSRTRVSKRGGTS